MKKQHLLWVVLCLATAQVWGQAVVASGTFGVEGDNLTWTLTDDGTLTISGEGEMEDYSAHPWSDLQTSITTVVIGEGVTSIGISNVFSYTTSLMAIQVAAGNAYFSSLDGVLFDKEQVTLRAYPIGRQGSYVIPDGVTDIGHGAFEGCSGLSSITIPGSVTNIGHSAFYGCSGLFSIAIPNSVTGIEAFAFAECTNLTSVIIPDGVTMIDVCTFKGCHALTSVTISEGVTSIGSEVFWECSALTSLTIPASVVSIGRRAFYGCRSLSAIQVEEENANYCSQDGALLDKEKTVLIVCPAGKQGEYAIPSGVTDIDDYAFASCEGLTSVTLPESVENIGEWAFDGCTGLTSMTIPDGVTNIEIYTFSRCESLTSVTIPGSVTSIGNMAFTDCSSLMEVKVEAVVPPTIETLWAFNGVDKSIPIYVPAESIEAYRMAEYWSEFTNFLPIEGESTGIASPSLSESIIVKDGEVHLNLPGTFEAQVYDLQGRHVLSTTETSFALPQGTYIIKIGDEAVKVAI